MGIASHECCERREGIFGGSNLIWIIILILIFCGGFGGSCGCGNVLGTNLFGGNSIWLLILLFLIFFSGNRIF